MNTNKQGRTPVYDNSLKIAIAREYLTGNLGYGALAEKHGITSLATVRHFVRWYKKHYPGSLQSSDASFNKMNSTSSEDSDVTQQLKEANLKIAALEMLIEIAQKELGIDIIKKPGTKQSSK